eukprot:1462180-Prymnesium_polylepis.1
MSVRTSCCASSLSTSARTSVVRSASACISARRASAHTPSIDRSARCAASTAVRCEWRASARHVYMHRRRSPRRCRNVGARGASTAAAAGCTC